MSGGSGLGMTTGGPGFTWPCMRLGPSPHTVHSPCGSPPRTAPCTGGTPPHLPSQEPGKVGRVRTPQPSLSKIPASHRRGKTWCGQTPHRSEWTRGRSLCRAFLSKGSTARHPTAPRTHQYLFNDVNPPATVQRQPLTCVPISACRRLAVPNVLVFETNSRSPAANMTNRPCPGSLQPPQSSPTPTAPAAVTHSLCSEHGVALLELGEDVS